MAAPPPTRRPPALMDELVEEILLRVPPDEPACLARAAVVCKSWCRLVTDPGFRRRFRQFHCTAPMLGQIVRRRSCGTQFLTTFSFRPSGADCSSWCPIDARHGRILFYIYDYHDDPDWVPSGNKDKVLIVWTPVSGEVRKLPMVWPLDILITHWNAALVCVAPGCDHMECASDGHFNVIFVSRDLLWHFNCVHIWSSEDNEWSMTARTDQPAEFFPQLRTCSCSALVRNSLYFLIEDNRGILEYSLGKKELSFIELPPICNKSAIIVLMSVDDDRSLGFAMVHDFSLCIWLRESGPTPSAGWTWTQHRVVDIKSFLPVSAFSSSACIVAAADAVGVFVIRAGNAGVLAIDLKSKKVNKVSDGDDDVNIIPYITFCTPALRATSVDEEPSMGASTKT